MLSHGLPKGTKLTVEHLGVVNVNADLVQGEAIAYKGVSHREVHFIAMPLRAERRYGFVGNA